MISGHILRASGALTQATPAQPDHRSSARLRPIRYGAAGAALLVAGLIAGFLIGRRGSSAPAALPDLGPAPTYTLTNQLGQRVSSSRFTGKVRIVTFLFPYCTTYCPLIAAHLIGFEHLLAQSAARNQVEVVAFNVAPEAAGPSEMRIFLKQYGWDPADPHWQFLTGTPAEIRHVVTDGYHIAFQRVAEPGGTDEVVPSSDQAPQLTVANPLAERTKVGFDVEHNDAIEIVDAHGRIRKIYDDADVVSPGQLWDDIAPLLKDAR